MKNVTVYDQYSGLMMKYYRKKKGLKTKEVANQLGISQQQLGKYERGINRPSIGIVSKFAVLLDLEINEVFIVDKEETVGLVNKYMKDQIKRRFYNYP